MIKVERIPTLSVSTDIDSAVFWSGSGNRSLAESFAESTTKKTLEMTPGGKYLDSLDLFSRYSRSQAILPWERLSARFAKQALGNVSAFTEGRAETSVFNRIELPILQSNPDIQITYFSAETSPEGALVFRR